MVDMAGNIGENLVAVCRIKHMQHPVVAAHIKVAVYVLRL